MLKQFEIYSNKNVKYSGKRYRKASFLMLKVLDSFKIEIKFKKK